jgi:dGTP triphosphohydrolase
VYGKRLVSETIRRIIHTLITDLIQTTTDQIQQFNPHHVDEIRELPSLVSFSDQVSSEATELKQFLFKNLYRHYQVNRMMRKARIVIEELFDAFMQNIVCCLPIINWIAQAQIMSLAGTANRRLYSWHDRSVRHARAPTDFLNS